MPNSGNLVPKDYQGDFSQVLLRPYEPLTGNAKCQGLEEPELPITECDVDVLRLHNDVRNRVCDASSIPEMTLSEEATQMAKLAALDQATRGCGQ